MKAESDCKCLFGHIISAIFDGACVLLLEWVQCLFGQTEREGIRDAACLGGIVIAATLCRKEYFVPLAVFLWQAFDVLCIWSTGRSMSRRGILEENPFLAVEESWIYAIPMMALFCGVVWVGIFPKRAFLRMFAEPRGVAFSQKRVFIRMTVLLAFPWVLVRKIEEQWCLPPIPTSVEGGRAHQMKHYVDSELQAKLCPWIGARNLVTISHRFPGTPTFRRVQPGKSVQNASILVRTG
jgi:hypothetical protein